MLENIIGQKGIVNNLKHELETGIIPQVLLFYGPEYSGKLSTALEVARILTCAKGKGEWACPCNTCKTQRLLNYPYLQMLGSRYFSAEIQASADTLLRTNKQVSKYLFIRAVRKLLKRFDPSIWEGNESNKKKAGNLIEEIEEKLDLIDPDSNMKNDFKKTVENISSSCNKLISYIKTENISINSIRKINYWAHFSASGKKKIIILENVHKMKEVSQNALLKLLEEPPQNVTIILLTTQKSALLQTVLSRLRTYRFNKRSRIDQLNVLKRIFREESPEYNSLQDFFLAWKNINPNGIKNLALKFINEISGSEDDDILHEMNDILKGDNPDESIKIFFKELLSIFQGLLGENKYEINVLEKWSRLIHMKMIKLEKLNMNPSLVLESIFYRMKEESGKI